MDQGFHFERFCSGTPSSYQFSALPFPRHNVEHEVTEKSQNCLIPKPLMRVVLFNSVTQKSFLREHTGAPSRREMFPLRRLGSFCHLKQHVRDHAAARTQRLTPQRWAQTERITQPFLGTGSEKQPPSPSRALEQEKHRIQEDPLWTSMGTVGGFHQVINERACRYI